MYLVTVQAVCEFSTTAVKGFSCLYVKLAGFITQHGTLPDWERLMTQFPAVV